MQVYSMIWRFFLNAQWEESLNLQFFDCIELSYQGTISSSHSVKGFYSFSLFINKEEQNASYNKLFE